MGAGYLWSNDDYFNVKQNSKGVNKVIDILEKIIDWIDNKLPFIVVPLAVLLILRVIFQMITY